LTLAAALAALPVLVAVAGASGSDARTRSARDVQPHFPIRAAFYYAWFPETWGLRDGSPFTQYHPSLGWYSSTAKSVIRRHLRAFRYGRIDAGILSWWGPTHRSDGRLARVLRTTAALRSRVRWAIYYECEGSGSSSTCGPNPSVAQIASDLAYVKRRYGASPAYLRVRGRPVVFVYGDGSDGCGTSERWARANAAVHVYLVLKIFQGYRGCPAQPDSWHQYGPASGLHAVPGQSVSVSPGFWLSGERAPRLARDPSRFGSDVRTMAGSSARWQLVTTFNEWGEGTAVESAREWGSSSGYGAYLDALHHNGR
jgi:hypothetical protein